MLRISCNDFESFVDALPAINGRYLQTRRSVRSWGLRIFPLGDVTVMLARGGAINVFHGLARDDQLSIYLPLSDPEAVALGGVRIGRDRIGLLAPGRDYLLRTEAPTRWLGLHFRLAAVRHRLALDDATARPLSVTGVLALPPGQKQHLADTVMRLHAISAADPEVLAAPATRRQADQQVLELIVAALDASQPLAPAWRGERNAQRGRIVERCIELIEGSLADAPTVEALCEVAGVSDRTLRTLFVERLGMAPHRYLMLRRIHAIHAALRAADREETVTAICSRYGVWDFGRFARQYRQLFGALPSQHLARATRH